ncbi:MAG: peptide-methionine (S)-S-oxide reductase MsrA [Cellvibrio sp.]|uniref:peptide-methionine (S)-S-oxide reductase MsrA n=1 Tax=Cellvibrio sp. TaxID=1965322 RepID=UPI00271FBE6F|nr:peptide-methionine (S)-S-oxide reductase MsrA [Cellvibrio sp.]
MSFSITKLQMPARDQALRGRDEVMRVDNQHAVVNAPLKPPFPDSYEQIVFGLGCFWGAERKFWQQQGVYTTAVGYAAGYTPNPTYEEVCSGLTGHNEVVLVVFNPNEISLDKLLKVFWESHDPTQGMRQGNDRGTQYRSGIYFFSEAQRQLAEQTKAAYQTALDEKNIGEITTEILPASEFFYAETYHQQYLHKNPGGYCGIGGTGVCFADDF